MVASQVDLDLVTEVAEVRARLQSNLFDILVWKVSLYSYDLMV